MKKNFQKDLRELGARRAGLFHLLDLKQAKRDVCSCGKKRRTLYEEKIRRGFRLIVSGGEFSGISLKNTNLMMRKNKERGPRSNNRSNRRKSSRKGLKRKSTEIIFDRHSRFLGSGPMEECTR